jgi:FimV-like protein
MRPPRDETPISRRRRFRDPLWIATAAARVFARCAGAMGRWWEARRALEACIAAVSHRGGDPEPLLLLEGEALAMTGDRDRAQALLIAVLQNGNGESRSEAMRLLQRLSTAKP